MKNVLITVGVVIVLGAVGLGATMLNDKDDPSTTNNTDMTDMQMPASSTEENASTQSSEVQEINKVTYKNSAVLPKSIKVKKGTTVTWTNEDTTKHDVTPDTETAEFKASELFGKGETYSVTFNTPGTYTYFCSPHPFMKGTIEVTE